jgi:hypothetical protein
MVSTELLRSWRETSSREAFDGLVDVLVLNAAIERLEAQDARKAPIIELTFFGGLTIPEAAEALSVSPRTVERELEDPAP